MTTSLERRAKATPRVSIKAGRAYWQPSKAMRARGFTGESLGRLTVEAMNRADELNEAADKVLADDEATAGEPDTITSACQAYEKSPDFLTCAPSTRAERRKHLARARAALGTKRTAQLTTKRVREWHDELGGGRSAYNHVMTLKTALAWAVENGKAQKNAAAGTKLERPESAKRIARRAELWAIVRAAERLGRPSVGVAAILLAVTMQRPADVRALTTFNVRDGAVRLIQRKTGADVSFNLHPDARAMLEAVPAGPLVRDEDTGLAYTERQLQRAWAEVRLEAARAEPSIVGAAPAAELEASYHAGPLCMRHFRATGMVWAAEGGASVPQIVAASGHDLSSGMKILKHYIVPTKPLADQAIARLTLHDAQPDGDTVLEFAA